MKTYKYPNIEYRFLSAEPLRAEGTVGARPFTFYSRGDRWTFSLDPSKAQAPEVLEIRSEHFLLDQRDLVSLTLEQASFLVKRCAEFYLDIAQQLPEGYS